MKQAGLSHGAAMNVIGKRRPSENLALVKQPGPEFPSTNSPMETRHAAFQAHAELQKPVTVHTCFCSHFKQERHLCSRDNFKLNRTAALAE